MSDSDRDETSKDVTGNAAAADSILENLHSLRDQIVTAWRERGVMLSHEEQDRLHAEIKHTCAFLTDLTGHH